MSHDARSTGQPFTLEESEVRRLVGLLADALAPDDGRAKKIERLMAGLCEWLAADGWFWVRSRIHPTTGIPENYDFLYGGGLDEHNLATYADRSLEVHGPPPENEALRRLMLNREHFTVSRTDVIADDVWAEPVNQDYVRRMGHDALMFSVRKLGRVDGGEVISYVLMLRTIGKPQFDHRDARLAQIVISECGALHTDGLNLTVAADIAALTPRQRTVLAMLIDGHGVKQTARRLNLSPHTVNDHCKAIYKHFDVTSRGELLRRFMTGAT